MSEEIARNFLDHVQNEEEGADVREKLRSVYEDGTKEAHDKAWEQFKQIAEEAGFEFTKLEWLAVVIKEKTGQDEAAGANKGLFSRSSERTGQEFNECRINFSVYQIVNEDSQLGFQGDGRNTQYTAEQKKEAEERDKKEKEEKQKKEEEDRQKKADEEKLNRGWNSYGGGL